MKNGNKNKEKDGHSGHKRPQYVVTLDLHHSLSVLARIGIQIPSREFVDEIEKQLVFAIRKNFTEAPIDILEISFGDMCDAIVSKATKTKKEYPDAVVLSSAPLIAYEAEGKCVHLNRIVDINGELIGIGPRPGYASVTKQLREFKNKSIIIIEDGSFTGSSLEFLLRILSAENVKAIVLGLVFSKAREALEKAYSGKIYHYIDSGINFLDWMPTHDFFPFVPNCGRVIGFTTGRTCFPFYLHHHASISMPYILPYGKPAEWASLKGDQKALIEFSQKCIDLTCELFREIAKLNSRNIKIGDLIKSNPRTNIPVCSGQLDFPDLNEDVLTLLNETSVSLYRMKESLSSKKEIKSCQA